MKREALKRLAIIGPPGSGKSTFAGKLGKILDIPVHHLDKHQFESNEKRDKHEFLSIQQKFISENSWLIEGCSFSTLEMRFARADAVIYFNFPRLLCMWRVFKRLFDRQIISISGCAKVPNLELLKYIWNFDKDKGVGIEELRRKYPHVKFIIFRNSKQAYKYMEKLNLPN